MLLLLYLHQLSLPLLGNIMEQEEDCHSKKRLRGERVPTRISHLKQDTIMDTDQDILNDNQDTTTDMASDTPFNPLQ